MVNVAHVKERLADFKSAKEVAITHLNSCDCFHLFFIEQDGDMCASGRTAGLRLDEDKNMPDEVVRSYGQHLVETGLEILRSLHKPDGKKQVKGQ